MRSFRILHFIGSVYSLVGWLGLIVSAFVCVGVTLVLGGRSESGSGLLMSSFIGMVSVLGLFLFSLLAIGIASAIDLGFEIQQRVYDIEQRQLTAIPKPQPQVFLDKPSSSAPAVTAPPASSNPST